MSDCCLSMNKPTTDIKHNSLRNFIIFLSFFVTSLIVSIIVHENFAFERVPFTVIIFLICMWPFFFLKNNPKYRLLIVYMSCYYLIFGMSNFIDCILGVKSSFLLGDSRFTNLNSEILFLSDMVVIIGALSFLTGFFLYTYVFKYKDSFAFAKDWNYNFILILGCIFWLLGFFISVSYNLVVSPMNIPREILGLPLGIASNMKLLLPFGCLMVIYLAIKGYKSRIVWPLLILIVIIEFCAGFIVNAKEASFRLLALIVLGIFFIKGTINKKIIVISILTFIPYLLFFNIYRNQLQVREITQLEAAKSFEKNSKVIINKAMSEQHNVIANSLISLKQRLDGKVYVDIIVNGTESGKVPFLEGETLKYLLYSLVPRMVWPQKPDMSTGQKFNLAFHLSDSPLTFVPTTQLGELYWNFRLFGVFIGMLIIGCFFGLISSLFLSDGCVTITRFMIILLASYFLALRSEVNIALQYSTFIKLFLFIFFCNKLINIFGLYQKKSFNMLSL